MNDKGLNQAKLSKALDVSRTIVTNWFKGDKFPRPDKLLKMGITLGLPINQLVIEQPNPLAPVVSFRKKMNRKTKTQHFDRAIDMGRLLELLVDFYPFDNIIQPPTLKQPSLDYNYLQKVSSQIRKDFNIGACNPVRPEHLIQKFVDLEVVVIPVLWGSKQNHENALRIYLPSSKTTWIYLNLDSNAHDFLFWMVHEMGHVISPSLHENTDLSEDFADEFAQAFLFPKECAENAYFEIYAQKTNAKKISKILQFAKDHLISPITVYKSINKYAYHLNKNEIDIDKSLYPATTKFNKKYPKISEVLNKNSEYTAADYIEISESTFQASFFKIIKKYLSENDKSPGFIQTILATTLLDAKEIHAELTK
ncbi:MAG: helix-turn-helix transcriptional regulator [Desulfobacula sp.]|nr:helix-turn-helix transcriptional regulator [Desulfobacula sp.]